jgi:hypothetical protein
MEIKRIIEDIKEEIEKEFETKKQAGDPSKDEATEFANSGCYCSDHHEHGAFL